MYIQALNGCVMWNVLNIATLRKILKGTDYVGSLRLNGCHTDVKYAVTM